MTKRNQTQIKLNREEVLGLIDAVSWHGHHSHYLTDFELSIQERLSKRLSRALDRL